MLAISELTDDDIAATITLWRRCGLTRPWNDAERDIAFARRSSSATVLLGRVDGSLAASAMTGHDGHRGAVYYVGVDPDFRGRGLGRAIMAAAEAWLQDRGVWKLNLLIRGDNARARGFYQAIGYGLEPNIQMAKRLDGTES